MLRRWRLEPLILDQLPSEGQTIIEKLEKYTAEVNFAVVLAKRQTEHGSLFYLLKTAYCLRDHTMRKFRKERDAWRAAQKD